jgi:phenylpropionate dioxygenase-like ring-hydroxylating dioxygenase large terminal subunit
VPGPLDELIECYDPHAPLAHARTIPAAWYLDERIADLERQTVFARSWQLAGRANQVKLAGQFVSCELACGEPIVMVRGTDGVLRGFFNVCRHHAATVVTVPEGSASHLRCPYHGWTYALDGQLKGTPDFTGVCDFDRAAHGLVPIEIAAWEQWIFVRVEPGGPPLDEWLGAAFRSRTQALGLERLQWVERRQYSLACNWKVFVDNYLDGGYHVPHLHKDLNSVLDGSTYTIENFERVCLQSSRIAGNPDDGAFYAWIYPNMMINAYAGRMDTNVVIPRGVDRTDVIFDFYFSDVSADAGERIHACVAASERIQEEDVSICASVQRGLRSRAYTAGRLSVRREAGEHLFHILLHDDLRRGLER